MNSNSKLEYFDELICKVQKDKIPINKNKEKFVVNYKNKQNTSFDLLNIFFKLMSEKTMRNRRELKKIIETEKSISVGFIDGFKDLFKKKKVEVNNLMLVSAIILAYAPIVAIKVSWFFLPNAFLFNIGVLTLGLLFPLFVIFVLFNRKISDHCLKENVMRFMKKNGDSSLVNSGINKVDFIYNFTKTENEEKNVEILNKIIEMEEENWKKQGINNHLLYEMIMKQKVPLDDFFSENEIEKTLMKINETKKI